MNTPCCYTIKVFLRPVILFEQPLYVVNIYNILKLKAKKICVGLNIKLKNTFLFLRSIYPYRHTPRTEQRSIFESIQSGGNPELNFGVHFLKLVVCLVQFIFEIVQLWKMTLPTPSLCTFNYTAIFSKSSIHYYRVIQASKIAIQSIALKNRPRGSLQFKNTTCSYQSFRENH